MRMGDLIWVGNILLPRGFVYTVLLLFALLIIGVFVWLTE